jgi:hypothetical protein
METDASVGLRDATYQWHLAASHLRHRVETVSWSK